MVLSFLAFFNITLHLVISVALPILNFFKVSCHDLMCAFEHRLRCMNTRYLEKRFLIFISLRERCTNAEFFLVHIFPHSDWIPENTDQKKLRTIFHTVFYSIFCFSISNHGLPVHTKTWNDLKPSRFRLFLVLVSTGTASIIYWRYHEWRMNSTNGLVAS